MNFDTRFFTNEEGSKLSDRLKKWGKHAQLLDILVGYFYSSGFHEIYSSLEEIITEIESCCDSIKLKRLWKKTVEMQY